MLQHLTYRSKEAEVYTFNPYVSRTAPASLAGDRDALSLGHLGFLPSEVL